MPAAGNPHDVALSLMDDSMRKVFHLPVIRCQMSMVWEKASILFPILQ